MTPENAARIWATLEAKLVELGYLHDGAKLDRDRATIIRAAITLEQRTPDGAFEQPPTKPKPDIVIEPRDVMLDRYRHHPATTKIPTLRMSIGRIDLREDTLSATLERYIHQSIHGYQDDDPVPHEAR